MIVHASQPQRKLEVYEIVEPVEVVPERPAAPHAKDGRTWKQALSDIEYFFRESFFLMRSIT